MADQTHFGGCVMSIGKLSRTAGVKIETIRFYERLGLIPRPQRTKGGQRLYDASGVNALVFIRRSRELQFTLEGIRALRDSGGQNARCADVREIAGKHLDGLRVKIAELMRVERLLAGAVARCTGQPDSSCPVLDHLAPKLEAAQAS